MSARTHAGPIVAALEAQQIAVAGVDLVSLAQLSIVRDLMALTQALDHEADRTAWLAILRAPWCGLTLKEISHIAGADRRATLWERLCDPKVQDALAPEAQARVRRLRAALAASFEESLQTYANGREALARRVESAWLRLGGPAACAQRCGPALMPGRSSMPWRSGPRSRTGPVPRSCPSASSACSRNIRRAARRCVQIMTIHHAKGLEFDHVILPGLGRPRRRTERTLLQWLDLPRGSRGSDLLMVAVPPAAALGPTALGRYVSRLQDQRERNEATRLLYVAATRARLQLHLFGQLEAATEEKPNPVPRSGTLLQRLWPADPGSSSRTCAGASTRIRQRRSRWRRPRAGATLERLSADWRLPPLPAGPQPVVLPIASYEAAPQSQCGEPRGAGLVRGVARPPAAAPLAVRGRTGAGAAGDAPVCSVWAARRRCCRTGVTAQGRAAAGLRR